MQNRPRQWRNERDKGVLHPPASPAGCCVFLHGSRPFFSGVKAVTYRIPITSDAVSYFSSDTASPQLAIVQRTVTEGGEMTADLLVFPDGGATLGAAFYVESVPHRDGHADRDIPGLCWAWPDHDEDAR